MRVACLFVLGLVAGCGDDSIEINTNVDNFCNQIADVACHNMYQCCTEGEIEAALDVSEPRTELQCRDDVLTHCNRAATTLEDSIAAGRVTFDPNRLNACLNSLVAPDDGTCTEVVTDLPWKTTCMDSAWVGTVALGGSCLFTHDCTGNPDNFCAPSQKCTAKPTAGLPCGTGCASAYYCQTGICQPKLGAGAMCTSSLQCATDLYCDTNALPTPVCSVKQPGGGACSSSLGCESGQCIPGQCMGSTQSCYRDLDCLSRCANTGISCTTSSQCSTGTCMIGGTTCTSNTQCTTSGDTCVFPVLCVPGDCIGDPVCTNATLTVDYCTGAVNQIPLI